MVCFKLTHTNIHNMTRRTCIVRRCYHENQAFVSSNSGIADKCSAMTSLINKMKVTVDKANTICSSRDASLFDSDECVVAWAELDDLIERYMTISKDVQRKKKPVKQHPNINDWDVVH